VYSSDWASAWLAGKVIVGMMSKAMSSINFQVMLLL
jgi:hypothetical protein